MFKQLLAAIALIFSINLILSACSTVEKPRIINSSKLGPLVQVYETIIVDAGATFDGKGSLYDWAGQGDCSQDEGMPPMFKLYDGAVLKNTCMKGAPDGIHVRGSDVIIDNIVNLDVCEDAISIKLDENKKSLITLQYITQSFSIVRIKPFKSRAGIICISTTMNFIAALKRLG